MTTYITELESSGKKRNYLSWNRQNQLIDSIAYFIRSSIIQDVKSANFFSISMDTTFDYSRKEQLP